jgi:TolB-like protein
MTSARRATWAVVCCCLTSTAALAADPPLAPNSRVAVLPIKAQSGVKDSLAAVVTEQLAGAIQKRHLEVMSPDDLQAQLGFERQKQLMGCTDETCLVEVGQALGVDKLVSGSIATIGKSIVINLALINNKSGKVDYRYTERVKDANDEAFLDLIPAAVNALFPMQETKPVAQAQAAGGSGRSVAAWTTLGVGVVGVAAGAAFFSLARTAQSEVAKGNPAPYATLQDKVAAGKTNDVVAGVALGLGGALVVTSVVLFVTRPAEGPAVAIAPVQGGGVFVMGGTF